MTDRTATLMSAREFMQRALELLDSIEAHLPAARLRHTIDILIGELEACDSMDA